MDDSDVRDGAAWMDDVGFDGYLLHPRPGVKPKFLGDGWMERIQDAINEATAREMDVWLYDEDSFPSGFAATATVNGTRVDPVGEPSTNDDLSDVLVDGTNDVRISIYVSPENALGPLHHEEKPWENGMASPWMFTSHAGENFVAPHQVGPAGMHDPFALVRAEDVMQATDPGNGRPTR